MFCNAHTHLTNEEKLSEKASLLCINAMTAEEFAEAVNRAVPGKVFVSLGIHPWYMEKLSLKQMEKILEERKDAVAAIGETGLDYFTKELKASAEVQREIFEAQIELAEKYGKPLIIHCRKSMQDIFSYAEKLSRMKAVVFHAFPGSLNEAEFLMKKSGNVFFSFGAELLKERKKSIECIKALPEKNILLENDASNEDIEKIYEKAALERNISKESLCRICSENFKHIFCSAEINS